jgi:nucleoside-diphosphate-sugar epimerase
VTPQRALVTGATGFIGRALAERLRATGVAVRGVARAAASVDTVSVDLASGPLDPRIFDGIDVVYHLAAKTHDLAGSSGAADEYWRVNVEGTRRVVDAARGRVRRMVFVSSVKAVDEGGGVEVDEQTVPHPESMYGRSKLAAEELVRNTTGASGPDSVVLRLPLVYGPGQRGNLERMIAAIARGRFPPPPRNGNRRSMVHVDNVVDALVLAGRHPAAVGRTYFVTDARPYSTREIYDLVRAALDRPPMAWAVPEPVFRLAALIGDGARRLSGRRRGFDSEAFQKLLGSAAYSSARIRQELGYAPAHGLAGAMPAMVGDRRGSPR